MSKIKEKLLNDNAFLEDAMNDYLDDEYHYQKNQDECDCNNECPCKGEPVTMEELVKNHNDWWDSLTEEEKQKIADEAQAASTYFDERSLGI